MQAEAGGLHGPLTSVDRRQKPVPGDPDGAARRLDRILRRMFPGDDEVAFGAVVEVDVIFGNEVEAMCAIDLLLQRARQAQHRHAEPRRRSGDALRHAPVARGRTEQRTMRLDVVQRQPLGGEKALEGAHLVGDHVVDLVAIHHHGASAESLDIRKAGMRTDLRAMTLRQLHRAPHRAGIAGVEAAGHIGQMRERHQGGIVAEAVEAIGLAHVAVDRDGHRRSSRIAARPARGRQLLSPRQQMPCRLGSAFDPYRTRP